MKNSELVFELGNQWSKDTNAGIYYAVPSWWRRFIYQVLTPREFVVYTYLASVADQHGIAYPTNEQIRSDLGIRSTVIIARAIERIVDRGFILKGTSRVRGRLLSGRAVYQRPHPAYTLLRLLETGVIDGRLFPTPNADKRRSDFTNAAVQHGLQRLVGAKGYQAYLIASDSMRAAILIQLLKEKLADSMIAAQAKATELPTGTSPIVSEMIAKDQGVPF